MRTQPSPRSPKKAKSPTAQTAVQTYENTSKKSDQRRFPSNRGTCRFQCAALACVPISAENLLDMIQIYEWRAMTDYPIVNCTWRRVIFNKSTALIANTATKQDLQTAIFSHIHQKASIMVQPEYATPLQNIELTSITQFLYALKESLIGFQRLFALFGPFEITSGLICVNSQGKVKVWVSDCYHLNSKTELNSILILEGQQQHMIFQLKEIFIRLARNGSSFREFFSGISESRTFIGCLKYIQDFANIKKIIISKNILKRQKKYQKRPLSPIINLKPVTRTPKFVASISKVDQQIVPQLLFGKHVQDPKDSISSQTNTKETSNQQDSFDLYLDHTKKVGKIVKNRGSRATNNILRGSRSSQNLHNQDKMMMQMLLQQSNMEAQMQLLLAEDPESEEQANQQCLTNFGREVGASVTLN